MERDPMLERRREVERVMVEEGQALWRRQREERRLQHLREQRELQEMLARYSPWGRPGGGAPHPDSLRKHKLHLQELYPDGDKGRTAVVAAPRPRQRSGQRSSSGGSAGIRTDTQLHFQANEPGRRCVDNVLRYRQPPQQQIAYRKELDAMVEERRRQREEEIRSCTERERLRGWTDESTLRSLTTRHFDEQEAANEEPLHPAAASSLLQAAGVELVPLLARRRTPASERHPLSSTDVTRAGAASPPLRKNFKAAAARSYTADLTQQVVNKQQILQRLRQEDLEGCRRHFATWQSLWGRPGHGAPREDALRRNLDHLLRQLPVT